MIRVNTDQSKDKKSASAAIRLTTHMECFKTQLSMTIPKTHCVSKDSWDLTDHPLTLCTKKMKWNAKLHLAHTLTEVWGCPITSALCTMNTLLNDKQLTVHTVTLKTEDSCCWHQQCCTAFMDSTSDVTLASLKLGMCKYSKFQTAGK